MSLKIAFLGVSALTALVLLVSIPTGEALQCYECNSISNDTCADPFEAAPNKQYLVTCKEDGFCRKQYQNIQSKVRVVRSCAYMWNKKRGDGECRQMNSESLRLLECQCKKEKCNSAAVPVASALTVLVPALLLYTQRQ